MKFVEEVVVEEFLPTLRSMLAEQLRERGLTQSEVATALGISQSAVSKYAHGDVARREVVVADERVRDLVEHVAEGLATGEMSQVQALIEAEVLIRELEGDLLGQLHEEAMPALSEYGGDFRVHDPDSELRTREQVRSSLRRGLRVLKNASGFAGLIPNVGANLVACTPGAATIDDVAGVPGRIFDVKGRVEVPGDPEFGVSEHVATLLLAAREAGSDASAALNVRYDPDIVERLATGGRVVVEFEAEQDIETAVRRVVAEQPDADVLYQTGGFGVEPIVYVLGPDPETVATTARELL